MKNTAHPSVAEYLIYFYFDDSYATKYKKDR